MRLGLMLVAAFGAALLPMGAITAQVRPSPASTAAREGAAKVANGSIRYRVIGDLASGKTPLLILHGAYMTGAGMKPFSERFATSRPVIVVDQRGHGRTGDIKGPISYELLADDAAAVLKDAGVKRVDVFGFSMGGGAGIQLAIRHPELVAKLVSISASYRSDGLYSQLAAGTTKLDPKVFDGTAIKRDYEAMSPTPKAFPVLVEKLSALNAGPQDWPAAQIKGIGARTMIVTGDYDIIRPEHSVDLFRLRGGGDPALVSAPFLENAPPARLAILPATSHLGVIAQPELIVSLVVPFLDDAKPAAPAGFF